MPRPTARRFGRSLPRMVGTGGSKPVVSNGGGVVPAALAAVSPGSGVQRHGELTGPHMLNVVCAPSTWGPSLLL